MLIYGKQIFLYILDKYPNLIEEVILSKEIDKRVFSKVSKLNLKVLKVDNKKAQALAKGGNHQGFLLRVKDFEFTKFESVKEFNSIVVLVGITDVGNIGSIVRSAYALGVNAIVVSEIKNLNLEAIVRTSSGAVFDMPISLYRDSLSLLNELKHSGFTNFASTMNGLDVRDVDFSKYSKKALFLGSEGFGISKKLLDRVDREIKVHMERDFDSLNVNSAASILIDRMR